MSQQPLHRLEEPGCNLGFKGAAQALPATGLKPFPTSCALARSLSLFSLPSPASPLTPPLPTQNRLSSSRNDSRKFFQGWRNFVEY